jgi:hypothetical protein
MCTDCGDFNYAKRFQCKGQIAIITGSRLKIGYHITLNFRRSNRYCYDPFSGGFGFTFSKEEDFIEWGHRLKIHGLDLRHIRV